MLEEALNSPHFQPGEAALALLSFFQQELPAGGSAAEVRFCRLFPLICARVFGTYDKGLNEFELGGWLSRQSPWNIERLQKNHSMSNSANTSTAAKKIQQAGSSLSHSAVGKSMTHLALNSSQRLDMDPVVQLLSIYIKQHLSSLKHSIPPNLKNSSSSYGLKGVVPTLVNAIGTETQLRPGIRFAFPLTAMNLQVQQFMMNKLQMAQKAIMLHSECNSHSNSPMFGVKSFSSSSSSRYTTNLNPSMEEIPLEGNAIKLSQLLLGLDSQQDGDEFSQMLQQQQAHEILQRCVVQQMDESNKNINLNKSTNSSPHHSNVRDSSNLNASNSLIAPNGDGVGANSIMASPISHSMSKSSTNNGMMTTPANTVLMLNMLEYYFITFGKFPQDKQIMNIQQQQMGQSRRSSLITNSTPSSSTSGKMSSLRKTASNYGDIVYLHLLKTQYLKSYLSHDAQYRHYNFLDHSSELFLRIMINFWFEGKYSTPLPTQLALEQHQQHQQHQRQSQSNLPRSFLKNNLTGTLDMAHDFTMLPQTQTNMLSYSNYPSNPVLVQRSIRCLVVHLVADPNIFYRIQDTLQHRKKSSTKASSSSMGMDAMDMDMDENSPSANDTSNIQNGISCLTPQMHMVQPSFYNYIRVVFKYAPLHLSDSAFFTALTAWLIWLEPWNVIHPSRKFDARNLTPETAKNMIQQFLPHNQNNNGNFNNPLKQPQSNSTSSQHLGNQSQMRNPTTPSRLTFPRFDAASKYTPEKWEPYVAANLHLYTVPLSIFLKRAKEFDFSTAHFDKSLGYIQRVLRVFSPALVKTIHKMTIVNENVLNDRSSIDFYLFQLKQIHEDNLGGFAPPPPTPPHTGNSIRSLSAPVSEKFGYHFLQCCSDAQTLIEELHFQQRKKIRELDFVDRFVAKFEGYFGTGVVQGNDRAIQKIMLQLRNMMELPKDFEFIPKDGNAMNGANSGLSSNSSKPKNMDRSKEGFEYPERDSNGFLTERGKKQVYTGIYKCNSLEMAEQLTNRKVTSSDKAKSYEIPLFVQLSYTGSKWLNVKLGLEDIDGSTGTSLKRMSSFMSWFIDKRAIEYFRIDLRFLADYRNLIWIGIFSSIFWKLFF